MKRSKRPILFVAVALACVFLSISFARSHEVPNDVENQSDAATVDESLLNLPDGKDAAFYLDALAKLESIIGECVKEAMSMEELRATVDVYAPTAKTIFYNLAKSSEEGLGPACATSFSLYVYYLALNERIDEAKKFVQSALDDPILTKRLQYALEEVRDVDKYRAYLQTECLSMFFENACRKGNVDRARALGGELIEDALTNDDALDELRGVARNSWRMNSEFGLETLAKIVDALSKSDDPKRRELAEEFGQERETRTKFFEGQKRFRELPGNDFEISGRYLDNTEIDWSSYRGKVTLVDMWATWCDACVAEFPNALKLYRKYRAAGFEIIAYSLDSDLDALNKFADATQLPWKIASSKLAENANEKEGTDYRNLMEYYGIEGIPRMILVGRDGKVIDTEARGKRLERLLQEAFPDVGEPTEEALAEWRGECDALYLFWTKRFRGALEKKEDLIPYEKLRILLILAQAAHDFERWEESVQYAERGMALAEDENYYELNRLAWLLVDCPKRELRNGKLALEAAQKAAQKTGFKHWFYVRTLAAAYAEVGDFDNAVKWAKTALELAEKDVANGLVNEDSLEDYQRAVELYSEKKTWRE